MKMTMIKKIALSNGLVDSDVISGEHIFKYNDVPIFGAYKVLDSCGSKFCFSDDIELSIMFSHYMIIFGTANMSPIQFDSFCKLIINVSRIKLETYKLIIRLDSSSASWITINTEGKVANLRGDLFDHYCYNRCEIDSRDSAILKSICESIGINKVVRYDSAYSKDECKKCGAKVGFRDWINRKFFKGGCHNHITKLPDKFDEIRI